MKGLKIELEAEKRIQFVLLLLILTYLLARAYFVVPMHDEIATFYHYIETGRIFEQGMVFDANNHFLNSYIGRFFYLIGLDHYFFYRIGNVLAFILYFYGLRKLTADLATSGQRILVLLASCSVPFVLEYFAYSRGYGMAMGFFVWQIYYTKKWAESGALKHAFKLSFFTFFTLLSNLIFMGSFCISLFVLVWGYFQKRQQYDIREKRQFWFVCLALIFSVAPLLAYSFFLKKIGALYYGSLDGLWEVTGETLSTYVLFADGNWVKWLLLILLVLGLVIYGKKIVSGKLGAFFQDTEQLIAVFFYGNLATILILAYVMQVNYPEDRAGMYLIPLFILLLAYNFQKLKVTKPLTLLLAFFPLTLIGHLSTDNSIFSPDMRIRKPFYAKIRTQIDPNKTLSLYPTMHLFWSYLERKQSRKIVPNVARTFDPYYDYILTRKELVPRNYWALSYQIAAEDQETGQVFLKRTKPFNSRLVLDTTIRNQASRQDTMSLLELTLQEEWRQAPLVLEFQGKIRSEKPMESLQLKIVTLDEAGKEVSWSYYEQIWNHPKGKQTFSLKINHVFPTFLPQEKKLRLYLFNRYQERILFTEGSTKLKSRTTAYGTR